MKEVSGLFELAKKSTRGAIMTAWIHAVGVLSISASEMTGHLCCNATTKMRKKLSVTDSQASQSRSTARQRPDHANRLRTHPVIRLSCL